MTRRRVVVCGATGFIGRNIAESLAALPDQFEVIGIHHLRPAFDHPGISWRQSDLADAAQAERAVIGADILIQAAATTSGAGDSQTRPYIHIADNAVLNSHLLWAAFKQQIKHFVFLSCSVMYPSAEYPQKEDDFDPRREIAPAYFGPAHTKLYIERMCEFYSRIGKTRHTVVRHSNIYGPHDKFDLERSHVFGATVTKAMTSRDGRVVVWGAGTEARDFLYVSDLVDFVRLALDRQPTQYAIYNVGCGAAVSVASLVQMIIAASGRNLHVEHDLTKPTIPTSVALDCSRARQQLDWRAHVPLTEGIARTLDWYRKHYGDRIPAAVRVGN